MPKHVADRLVRGDVINDHFMDAVVLFADIVGFTSHSSMMPAADVVALLEHIYSTFDAICERYGVTKVKTIGDSYMCFIAGDNAAASAYAMVNVALAMLDASFTWPSSATTVAEPIAFRIGMHQGDVAAGVIGTQRMQYDVWGDTVNVASRMESTSEPGRIQISEAVVSNLKMNTEYRIQNSMSESENAESNDSSLDSSLLTPHLSLVTLLRGDIEIKGKGMMTTYWLS